MTAATRSRRFLIMAGGTGGHVFPALAVAENLRQAGHEVEWLGTSRGLEATVVPAAGFDLHCLAIGGLRGRGLVNLLKAPWAIGRAIWTTLGILRARRPQVVVGLGGYVTGPGGVAAKLMGIPLVIHEQNAVAGTTNRLLARLSNRVLTAFPQVLPNAICIGNPVRTEIAALAPPAVRLARHERPFRLLVLGGSLGASALNQWLPKALAEMDEFDRPDVWHQAGKQHLEAAEIHYRERRIPARIEPFIADMAAALGWADLVICRAGALTVAELCAAGVASILVPYPFAIDDHQTANAQWLVQQQAAVLCPQDTITASRLADLIHQFCRDPQRTLAMAEAARAAAKPQATATFTQHLLELANG